MFDIVEFITGLFKKNDRSDTGLKAKERLKLVLISDRATVSPHIMEALREELLEVISRYMTVDAAQVEMGLQRTGNAMALAANIPVISMKRNEGRTSTGRGSAAVRERAERHVRTELKVKTETISAAETSRKAKDRVKSTEISPVKSEKKQETVPEKKPAKVIVKNIDEPEETDEFNEEFESTEIITVSTFSEVSEDEKDSDENEGLQAGEDTADEDDSAKNRNRKRTKRYKERSSSSRRTSRKKTRV